MSGKKITLIYIMGAGRSGSTILSTVLGISRDIFNCADLMQLYEYGCLKKNCNDGETIFLSPFWSKVLALYDPEGKVDYCKVAKDNFELEGHRCFIKNFMGLTPEKDRALFMEEQERLIMAIARVSNKSYIVDSSKYANRAFLLSKAKNIDVKFIYNIRDPRGVINSFGKKVQTSKSPFSTVLYYNAVNLMSELVYLRLHKSKKIKIRYEDLMLEKTNTLRKVSNFLGLNFDDIYAILEKSEDVEIGPVIEGNRMVKKRRAQLSYDNEWLTTMDTARKFIYSVLSLPFMIINKYRFLG